MLKKVSVILLLCFAIPLYAQEMSDEYELMFGEREAFDETVTDSLSSSYPGDGITIFNALTRYSFNFISYRNRGYDGRNFRHYLGDLEVSPVTDKYPDYSFYKALRISVPDIEEYRNPTGGFGAVFYGMDPSKARRGIGLRADYSEIHYRGGVRLSAAGNLGKRWNLALKASYRGGRDKFIGGVFSESWIASAAVAGDFGRGGKLTLFGMGTASDRGMRNWTVREAFMLTGDNLYNPSWGWSSGKPRNSNVRNDVNGLFAATYDISVRSTYIKLSVMYRESERCRSRLVWENAISPMPDHYSNLPGYYSDPQVAEELEYIWMNDSDIRQIDWQRLYDINRNSGGESVYMLGEEVSRATGLQAAVSAISYFSKTFRLGYGLRFSTEKNGFFSRVGDMLGGEYYLESLSFGENMIIRTGDRFGYDFRIPRASASAYVSGAVVKGKWTASFAAELSRASLFRADANGITDTPREGTLTGSERLGFTTHDVKFQGDYCFSSSHKLSAAAWAGNREPSYQDIFLDPRSGNPNVQGISMMSAAGAEVRYRRAVSQTVMLELSAYYTHTFRETEVYRYYDNAESEYVIMPLKGVSKRFAGIEAAVTADITGRFSLMAGASINKYVYAGDAMASFYRSADMELLVRDEPCRIKGLVCSPSPQNMFVLSATYSIPYKWSFEASFVYGGSRYVAINPVRRTPRIYGLAQSSETAEDFLSQQRLPTASSVDLSVSRRFRLRGCYAYVVLVVRNMLGNTSMIYGGYEQMRIEGNGTGVNRAYSPAPSRYAYCYPRSVFATVSINF